MPKPFESKAGTYTGSGATQAVTVGFKPTFLFLYNDTDGDTVGFVIQGQADGTTPNIAAAVAESAANGVTLTSSGFSLGSDAIANENAKAYRYFAIA